MAEKKKVARKPAEPKAPAYPVEDGDLSLDGRGPVACGEHNASGLHLSSTDDPDPTPAGFQSDCEACVAQLTVVLDHAGRDTTRV